MGVDNLIQVFEENYYKDLKGGILEAFGNLFSKNVTVSLYPMLKNDKLINSKNLQVDNKMKNLYKLDNINLNYNINGNDIRVLKNINFEIKKNERVALMGESGSGKTSLLMLMSGLENPSKGSIIFENKDFSKINEEQKTIIRKKKLV